MEFHQLRYFVEVARQKNFSRAAEACHVAQPSLSQQLKKLEEELGQPLLRRTQKGALLTEFGASMLPQALQILSGARSMLEEAHAETSGFFGRVSVGVIPTIAPYLLPYLIKETLGAYPQMQLKVVENTTKELVAQISDGSLDFAILSPPFEGSEEMELTSLMDDELLIVLPQEHALAHRPVLGLKDLSNFPMVLMRDVHCLSQQSISICEASGLKLRVSLESSQMETVISMVEAGMGFSFMPRMAKKTFEQRKLTFSSVAPTRVTRKIALVASKYQRLSPSQEAFCDLVKAARLDSIY